MASTMERPDAAERSVPATRSLQSVLGTVRRRIRAYVAVEGAAATVVAAGCGLFALLGLDWLFEPPAPVRLLLVGVALLFVLGVFYRRFVRRLFARLADRSLALVLERRFRTLNDALLTSVDVDDHTLPDIGRSLLAETRREAATKLQSAALDRLFDPRPRRRAVAGALLAAVCTAAFALNFPDLFRLGVDRLLARSDEPWPRRTSLSIDGFVRGERVVAEGSDVELTVRADTSKHVPREVYLRYRSDDGVRDEQLMDQEGIAKPGIDDAQKFKHVLRGVSSSLTLDVFGGDARLRSLRLRVVPRPQVKLRVACKYPPYTRRADGELEVTGTLPLPQGTIVTVLADANKPLRRVDVGRASAAASASAPTTIDVASGGEPVPHFVYAAGRLDSDLRITFDLHDADGIDNRAALSLQAVVDQPPSVQAARKGVDLSVTPQARLPIVGKITDDYGLERSWFEYGVDGAELRELASKSPVERSREFALAETLELPELYRSTQPPAVGQMLSVVAKAQDARSLPDAPQGNIAAGEVLTFTIVSDDELLRLLEAREIALREQFKALIDKVTRDRDSLVGLGEKKPAAATVGAAAPPAEDGPRFNREKVTVDQARSHGKENRAETLAVAAGFAAIVEELENNRVANGESLRSRLANDVAAPLRRIGDELFADYETRLTALQRVVDRATIDAPALATTRAEALRSADAVLVEMHVVLNKMLELENFKEAVDLLRSIIAMQREIGEQTKKQRSNKMRLLQD